MTADARVFRPMSTVAESSSGGAVVSTATFTSCRQHPAVSQAA